MSYHIEYGSILCIVLNLNRLDETFWVNQGILVHFPSLGNQPTPKLIKTIVSASTAYDIGSIPKRSVIRFIHHIMEDGIKCDYFIFRKLRQYLNQQISLLRNIPVTSLSCCLYEFPKYFDVHNFIALDCPI